MEGAAQSTGSGRADLPDSGWPCGCGLGESGTGWKPVEKTLYERRIKPRRAFGRPSGAVLSSSSIVAHTIGHGP